MKKVLLFLLLFSFTNIVMAESDYCTVVSGNGRTIGDEISCGTEHFYVIENKDNNIRMMSKYNLYVGSIFDKRTLDISKTYIKYKCRDNDDDCNKYDYGESIKYYFEGEQVTDEEDWINHIKTKYRLKYIESLYLEGFPQSNGDIALYREEVGDVYVEDNKRYRNITYKLYPYESITEETEPGGYALQNKSALGVTGEKGNANYPIYATLVLFPGSTETVENPTKNHDSFLTGYTNFDFKDNTDIKGYLDTYKSKLNNMGYNVSNVDMINIKEINDLVYSISKSNLPLLEWYNASINTDYIEDDAMYYKTLGDLKEYLSDDYKWLWNTTYWTKTFVGNDSNDSGIFNPQVYFVSSSGEICYSQSDCSGIPRAGIRPIATISLDDVIYSVATKTDGNGSIKVSKMRAKSGNVVSFTVKANDGYVLDKVEVTDSDGNVLTFTDYNFTMPDSNVLVEATFIKKDSSIVEDIVNPQTGFGLEILFLFIILIVSFVFMVKINNKRINNNVI